MYLKGQYQPLMEADAVRTVKDMLRIFYRANIDVIRVGLKSSDNLALQRNGRRRNISPGVSAGGRVGSGKGGSGRDAGGAAEKNPGE